VIRRTAELDESYRRLSIEEDLSHEQSLRIFESLYAEAVSLGVINDENILEGLEVDLRIARALNGLRPSGTRSDRRGFREADRRLIQFGDRGTALQQVHMRTRVDFP